MVEIEIGVLRRQCLDRRIGDRQQLGREALDAVLARGLDFPRRALAEVLEFGDGPKEIGAVLFRTRLDMSPDSMGEMTAKHAAMPGSEPGVYRFKADFTMAGGWAL